MSCPDVGLYPCGTGPNIRRNHPSCIRGDSGAAAADQIPARGKHVCIRPYCRPGTMSVVEYPCVSTLSTPGPNALGYFVARCALWYPGRRTASHITAIRRPLMSCSTTRTRVADLPSMAGTAIRTLDDRVLKPMPNAAGIAALRPEKPVAVSYTAIRETSPSVSMISAVSAVESISSAVPDAIRQQTKLTRDESGAAILVVSPWVTTVSS